MIQRSRGGVRTAVFACPLKYIHTVTEMAHKRIWNPRPPTAGRLPGEPYRVLGTPGLGFVRTELIPRDAAAAKAQAFCSR